MSISIERSVLSENITSVEAPTSLPNTGYDVKADVRRFKKDIFYFEGLGYSLGQSLYLSSQNIAKNMEGYWMEYIKRTSVIPISVSFSNEKEKTVICPDYGGIPLTSVISPLERNGAVKDSVFEATKFLEKATPGSMALFTSPPGNNVWSGENRSFLETQTFIYLINESGELEAKTIITDMNLSQNINLLRSLGSQKTFSPDLNKSELEEEVVRTVVFRPSEVFSKNSFQDVLSEMEVSMDMSNARGNITFEEYKKMLGEEAFVSDSAKEILEKFKIWVVLNISDLSERSLDLLSRKVSYTVLELVAKHKEEQDEVSLTDLSGRINISQTLQIAQALSGCAGGGMVGNRRFVEGKRILCCKCPICKQEVSAEIYGGHIHCPKCRAMATWAN